MNMSKIRQCNEDDDCTPWQATQFEPGRNQSSAAQVSSLRTRGQREHADQQAYQKGFDEGLRDGTEQGKKDVFEQFGCLESVMNSLARPLQKLDEQVVDEVVQLAMLVAGQLVRRELKTSPGEVVATVKEAIALLPVANADVQLVLHPGDAATVRESLSSTESEPVWKIVEDPLLTRGGCRITTHTSTIDATVESRLNAAIVAVLGSERKNG